MFGAVVPGNCLVCAILAWALAPSRTRVRALRNRRGRLHFYWTRDGRRYEFHAPGRSTKTYLQNSLYVGRVREF